MAPDNEEIVPEDFSNLILDDTPIGHLTQQDRDYLAKFINLERLSMNATGLRNLDNLPTNLKIAKVSDQLSLTLVSRVDGTQ